MNQRSEPRTALILGATGGVGGEVGRVLAARGWRVRAMHRQTAQQGTQSPWQWVHGDAMRAEDVRRAAEGAEVIVHAVNPPGYKRWAELVLPMMDATISAARANAARVVLPGSVYNFGPDAGALLQEDSPQNPTTRKGAIRKEMERRLADSGVPALIVRAGDFFGPRAGNNWFSQGLVRVGAPVRTVWNPGRPGVGHQWAYLPDLAETIARLMERATPARFERFHFGGHWDADGTMMIAAIRRAVVAAGGPTPRVRALPWSLLGLAAPFSTLIREMKEMRYLWERPVQLDGGLLSRTLAVVPHTPWDEAVASALEGLGCTPFPTTWRRDRSLSDA